MTFFYKTYNIPVVSSISIPGLMPCKKNEFSEHDPIYVGLGKVPKKLKNKPTETRKYSSLNQNEYLLKFQNIAHYYVKDGNNILIEPISQNFLEVLVHFYSSCLAVVLLQRNILTSHVSGVIVKNKVVLVAADSGTGKSTTSVKLQELGYPIFTDDTAILNVEDGICYARASYPMTKLWQETIEQQFIYAEESKDPIFEKINKYSFNFHDQFISEKMPVATILFLEKIGDKIQISPMRTTDCLAYLINNVYVNKSIIGMKKQKLQFEETCAIAQVLPAYLVQRPSNISTLDTLAESIVQHIF